ACSDDLIEQNNIRLDRRADAECQPQHHALRIASDWQLEIVAEFRELRHIWDQISDFLTCEPKERASHSDIFETCCLGVHADVEIRQTRDATDDIDTTTRWRINPSHDPQKRCLARAVRSDQSDPSP